MKYILLSADNLPSVYSVPDIVADNLEKYCLEFCEEWLHKSPHAKEYRKDFGGYICACYDERDFIKYLNTWIFPNNPSLFIETLCEDIPQKYNDCKRFNF